MIRPRTFLPVLLLAVLAVGIAPSAGASVTVKSGDNTIVVDPTGGPAGDRPAVSTSACATTGSGRRIACVDVEADRDGDARGWACLYDDSLGVFGWSLDRDLGCVEITEDWGYVTGPGACVRALGVDRPQTCVNGSGECALWVMSVRVLCRA